VNCKPGELAVIVSGQVPEFIGRIVQVTELDMPFWPTAWRFVERLIPSDGSGEIRSIDDCALRPIRDPGHDAVDEMVQIARRKRVEKASEPDPAYVGQTYYEPGTPPGFVGV
jgi:hypothetical protein